MKVFQLVKTVLDELYSQISATTEASKDDEIRAMMDFLGDEYKKLAKGVSINYSAEITRFAYIYKYVTAHANFVYQVIRGSSDLVALFDREKVNVTCIGGGPGSDFIGILKFIAKEGNTQHLICKLFDREPAWAECWEDVDEKLEAKLRVSTSFQIFDVTDKQTWADKKKYLNADLFTMIYFMSEIGSHRVNAEAFFSNLFNEAKEGALFLYIDNNDPQFYGWFDSLAAAHSLTILQSEGVYMHIDDYDEEKTDLADYWNKFSNPRLTGRLAFRVCRKG
ncbi:MAG TPA: hypothetical protein VEX60_13790 [Pyrinomonadaceae bacterium]|nr:hypothetical protein [Pyrinomonadaceae bacterium]